METYEITRHSKRKDIDGPVDVRYYKEINYSGTDALEAVSRILIPGAVVSVVVWENNKFKTGMTFGGEYGRIVE